MTGDDTGSWAPRSRFETGVPGVYAVGDVRHGATKRVASGVGRVGRHRIGPPVPRPIVRPRPLPMKERTTP